MKSASVMAWVAVLCLGTSLQAQTFVRFGGWGQEEAIQAPSAVQAPEMKYDGAGDYHAGCGCGNIGGCANLGDCCSGWWANYTRMRRHWCPKRLAWIDCGAADCGACGVKNYGSCGACGWGHAHGGGWSGCGAACGAYPACRRSPGFNCDFGCGSLPACGWGCGLKTHCGYGWFGFRNRCGWSACGAAACGMGCGCHGKAMPGYYEMPQMLEESSEAPMEVPPAPQPATT